MRSFRSILFEKVRCGLFLLTDKEHCLLAPRFALSTCNCTEKSGKTMALRYTKISCNAFNPVKGSNLAAGYDLRSAYDYVVPSKGQALCQTDLKICLPNGCYGRIAPRSGLALKNSIHVGGGVIDADYRGNVGVILLNLGDSDFIVKQGDRIAQLICEKIYYPHLEEVTELDNTERGENGFGSSGIH